MFVGGCFLVFMGCQESKLSSGASSEPQEITAEALIKNGYGENAHVKVTDIIMFNDYVYEANEDAPNKFTKVWIPAVEASHPWSVEVDQQIMAEMAANNGELTPASIERLNQMPYPKDFGIILISDEPTSQAQVDTFIEQESVQGLIVNKIDKLSGEELKYLKQSYPNVDPANVIIIEHDRKPAGGGKVYGFIGGGIVLMLLGPGLLLMGRRG